MCSLRRVNILQQFNLNPRCLNQFTNLALKLYLIACYIKLERREQFCLKIWWLTFQSWLPVLACISNCIWHTVMPCYAQSQKHEFQWLYNEMLFFPPIEWLFKCVDWGRFFDFQDLKGQRIHRKYALNKLIDCQHYKHHKKKKNDNSIHPHISPSQ